jgi:hypothetical protein
MQKILKSHFCGKFAYIGGAISAEVLQKIFNGVLYSVPAITM